MHSARTAVRTAHGGVQSARGGVQSARGGEWILGAILLNPMD
jgi:hypothetical protein